MPCVPSFMLDMMHWLGLVAEVPAWRVAGLGPSDWYLTAVLKMQAADLTPFSEQRMARVNLWAVALCTALFLTVAIGSCAAVLP